MPNKKVIFFCSFALTLIPTLLGIDWQLSVSSVQLFLLSLGRLLGLIGTILLLWQYLLGTRTFITKYFVDLFWLNKVHSLLGKYGFILMLFHPLLVIIMYYASYRINLLGFDLSSPFGLYKTVGVIAFLILSAIWLLSAFLREKISFRSWKFIHLATYIILPLVLLHSLMIGTGLNSIEWLRAYWVLLLVVFALVSVYRLLSQLGVLKEKYIVLSDHTVSNDVEQIWLQPQGKVLVPKIGQFVYLQSDRLGEAHPFSVSHYDSLTGNLAITAKASGPFSSQLLSIKQGNKLYVQGPYGIFTKEALETTLPVVLIAGGIGIAPFLRLIEELTLRGSEVWLFYGCRTEKDIAFSAELQEIEKTRKNFKVVYVLSEQDDYVGNKGYITKELISSALPKDLYRYHYCICGPIPMMKSIKEALIAGGVSKTKIEIEKFSI